HPRRIQRLPARGRGGHLCAPGGGRGGRHRRPRREARRGGEGGRRAQTGRQGERRGHHRIRQGAPGRVQVPAHGAVRRHAAQGRDGKDPEERAQGAARGGGESLNEQPFFEPLTARDAWFLYAERPQTPLDLGTVSVVEGESQIPGGRGALGVEETIKERIHLVPRYRQRIHRVPLNLVHPVWVDDPHFDPGAHVRREVLAPPGDGATLRKLVMRIL